MIDVDDLSVRTLQRFLPPEVAEFVMLLRRTRRDVYDHSVHVSIVARRLARTLCFSPEDVDVVVLSAYLHDVGKNFIPDSVLYKAGVHEHNERTVMRQHAFIGETCLAPFLYLREIAVIVGQHHEKVDGSGYPRQLRHEDIDPRSRVLSIADAATAMIEERSYQRAVSPEAAIMEIRRCAGSHFDPDYAMAMRAEFLLR